VNPLSYQLEMVIWFFKLFCEGALTHIYFVVNFFTYSKLICYGGMATTRVAC